jgi:hypothetical protein
MNAPAAIQAQLVDVRNVTSHRCVRLEIHVPAEQAGLVMAAFGWPTMADPVPVALARLVEHEPSTMELIEKHRIPFDQLPLPQQAAMRCNDIGFRAFIRERGGRAADAGEAATFVRLHCAVSSRKDIIEGTTAGERWKALDADYYASSRGMR